MCLIYTCVHIVLDQLCIDQRNPTEKSLQISLMSEIYTKASRVIIWLGIEDEHTRMCRQWLDALASLIPTLNSASRIMPGSPKYDANWRHIIVADTFNSPATSPLWARAIMRFWSREWWRRGWVVQEFLLAREVLCLTGDVTFSMRDLTDMFAVPPHLAKKYLEPEIGNMGYRVLMLLKRDGFPGPPQQPLLFLHIMAAVAEEFVMRELGDRLYGFLGLLAGLEFVPDYTKPLREEFTRFAATLARQYGSLDFLSMWSSNLDELLENTPPELLGFPSWAPSFSWLPLTAPWRLAVGAVRSWSKATCWNAALGRKHKHDQLEDASTTGMLRVRGKIVDYIGSLSTARVAKWVDTDDAYRNSIVEQIQADLPEFSHWKQVDLIQFLNVASCNGQQPNESAEQILDSAVERTSKGEANPLNNDQNMKCCMSMGRGRKFMVTAKGKKGLAPWIGSVAGAAEASAIVVLHGCVVPMVLSRIDGFEDNQGAHWKVIGDAYVEGLMLGEGVTWAEDDADEFVLV